MKNTLDTIEDTEIRKSNTHGHGLFSLLSFDKDFVLGFLDGQTLTELNMKILNISGEWNALPSGGYLVRQIKTKYFYINHSRTPNLEIMYNPIRIVALREIKIGEELLLDYRKEPLSTEYLLGHGNTYL